MRRALLFAPLALLAGCNQYELYRVAGYEQLSFSNDADIVFIIDNSNSMQDEAEDLASNLGTFIDRLTSTEGTPETDDLTDAVQNYVDYVNNRGQFIDYQLALTTTSIDSDAAEIPGTAGELIGGEDSLLTWQDEAVGDTFTANLLCDATCWQEATLPSDPSYVCGDDTDIFSAEYLDCLCGFEAWEDHCGSGNEEHLEAALLTLCRAVEDPPDFCYENTPFTEAQIGSNAGLLRENSTLIFVVVTDEGDESRRLTPGDNEADPYLDLFAEFDVRYRFAVIGPNYDAQASSLTCNSGGATTYGSMRLQDAAITTEGFYNPIAEEGAGGDCQNSDFAVHLEDLGALLASLQKNFPLQAWPDVSTIAVYIDGVLIDPSELDADASEEAGYDVYGTGWSYDPASNSITFHGDAVPDYNEDVEIFYRPLEGTPRTLPF